MQTILDNNINIVSISSTGLLMHSDCINPFFSPNGRYIAFWSQDYDSISDIFLNTYHLYIKDTLTNILTLVDTGNGNSPVLNNSYSYTASFSPDSSRILFLTTSTNLIIDDSLYSSTPNTNYRWYVRTIDSDAIQRVIEDSGVYGNKYDFAQALWYDDISVVCVSFSNNLGGVSLPIHSEVFIKNISTNTLALISTNGSNFTTNSYNISIGSEKVAFFNNILGYCYVTPFTNLFQRVQLLPDMINYGIVSTDVLQWNTLGTQFIFRIQSGNTIPTDNNNAKDDFIYDLTNDVIIPVNENSLYGNAESSQTKFSPDDLYVSFLTASSNIDPSADNDVVNLYIKEISTGIVTKISRTDFSANNYKLLQDVLGYNWIDNERIVFTTNDRVITNDTNNTIDWVLCNTTNNNKRLLNYVSYGGPEIFTTINNDYVNIRRDSFYPAEHKVVFSSTLSKLNVSFITPYYNKYNIFSMTFNNNFIGYPLPVDAPEQPLDRLYVNDSAQANIKNIYSADIYKEIDYANNGYIPDNTMSISASPYVEHINSIQYRNITSDIRWMSFKYPNLPINTNNFFLGMGVFQSSPTLVDDVGDILGGSLSSINPVIGVLTKMSIVPKNDVALITSGEDQYQVCAAMIFLSASIIGNTSGHTFLWEQLTGATVSIIQNTTTTAYYLIADTSTDKVFRFWIDKGKFNEQYQDITIYATPTSILTNNIINSIGTGSISDPNLTVRGYNAFNDTFDYSISFNSLASYSNSSVDIAWDLPSIYYIGDTEYYSLYKSLFNSTYLEIHDGADWVKYNEASYNDPRIKTSLSTGSLIRFASTYYRNGQNTNEIYYTIPEYVSSNIILGYEVLGRTKYSASEYMTMTSTIYVIDTKTYDDTISNIINSSSENTILNSTVYIIESVDVEDTINAINNSMSLSYTITLFEGGVIGG